MSASNTPRIPPSAPTAVVFDVGNVLLRWDPRNLYRTVFADEAAMDRFLSEVCTMAWHGEQDRGRTCAEAEAELVARLPNGRTRSAPSTADGTRCSAA